MAKIAKTIKISFRHEEWLKEKSINFSQWVRNKLDEEMNQQTDELTKNRYKAVILAASKDSGLLPLTESIPKTLLDIKGKTILQRQVEILRKLGVNDIAVVRGYQKEKINYPNLHYFDNLDYNVTGNLISLLSALDFINRETIVLYGDILFDIESLRRLIDTENHTFIVVDRGWKKRYRLNLEDHPLPPELVSLTESGEDIEITDIGIELKEAESTSEFIGLAKISTRDCKVLRELQQKYKKNHEQPFHQSNSIREASFVDFIRELLMRGDTVYGLEIWRSWIDIDTFEDYRQGWKMADENTGVKK